MHYKQPKENDSSTGNTDAGEAAIAQSLRGQEKQTKMNPKKLPLLSSRDERSEQQNSRVEGPMQEDKSPQEGGGWGWHSHLGKLKV